MNEKQRIKAILALGQKRPGWTTEAQRIAFETEMSPADAAIRADQSCPSYRLPAEEGSGIPGRLSAWEVRADAEGQREFSERAQRRSFPGRWMG